MHKARLAQAAIRECGFEQLAHPSYSPDLAPSDFHLVRFSKSHLRGQRLKDDQELTTGAEEWFDTQSEDTLTGIAALVKSRSA